MTRVNNATMEWKALIGNVILLGEKASPRGQATKEIRAYCSQVDMRWPVVQSPLRALSYQFMLAEAYWILTGDSRVSTIAPYCKNISRYSDDGVTFNGAYGPRVVAQLPYVVENLLEPHTRQAVLTIWERNPRPSKDIPCTLGCQFFIREDTLHCIDLMRSSDAWLGWPYDIFNFTMLTAYIALLLRRCGRPVRLGTLTLFAGSQHLYDRDQEKAARCLFTEATPLFPALDLGDYESPENFLEQLKVARDGYMPPATGLSPLFRAITIEMYERNRVKAVKGDPGKSSLGDVTETTGSGPVKEILD